MTSKRKHAVPETEIRADEIVDYLLSKSLFDKACEDVFETFQDTSSYKYLKDIGLHQISTATEWNTTPYEEVQKKARMHYDKIQRVTSTVEDEFDRIIQEKLNGPFRSFVKGEILKFLREKSLLSNNHEHGDDREDKLSNNGETAVKVEIEEGEDSEISSDILYDGPGNSAQNESLLDEISLGSPSSVHTSDLSSFEDEISISSDEEGTKRMVSFSFAAEELKRCRENRLSKTPDSSPKKEENVKIKNEVMEEIQSTNAQNTSVNSPRRVRKPNSKYFSSDVLSPFDIDSMPNTSHKISTPNSTPVRKRGRPRKYHPKQ